MFKIKKSNLLPAIATIMFIFTLTLPITIQAQTDPEEETQGPCETCAGRFGEDESCENVSIGADFCIQISSNDCIQGGSCQA